jgi:2'-5' RNA ligase
MERIRVFISIDTPAVIKELLTDICSEYKNLNANVRWEPQDKYHCTLSFLGDINSDTVFSVSRAVEIAAEGLPKIPVSYTRLGSFSGRGRERPTILWVGIDDPDGTLRVLHDSIQQQLALIGFPAEKRRFTPHVTLGRSGDIHHLRRLLASWEKRILNHPPVTIGEVNVVRSDLDPGGSRYTVLRNLPLSGRQL